MPEIARGSGVDSVASVDGAGYLCGSPMTTSTNACSGNVFAIGIGVVRKGDAVTTHPTSGCGPESPGLSSFSPDVFANGLNIGRNGDNYSANTITSGAPTVWANTGKTPINTSNLSQLIGIYVPEPVTTAETLESFGWPETSLNDEQISNMAEAEKDAPQGAEIGEYGDGYFGGGSPRGDSNFQGNSSPVTGETGILDTPEESESTYPEATSSYLNFLPHTDPRIQPGFKSKLESVAKELGTTLTITSAYRDPSYNARVGGKKASKHMLGIAVDVVMSGFSTQGRIDFIQACINNGITGIGVYNSFTHVDTGGKRAWGPNGSRTSLGQQSWIIPTLSSNGYHI